MLKKYILTPILFTILSTSVMSQVKWIDPLENEHHSVSGQLVRTNDYTRLPELMKDSVRTAIWDLSRHAAGLSLIFHTTSPRLQIEYQVAGPHQMPHMPATAVSGLDLYAKTHGGDWLWFKGSYSFSDTIRYTFDLNVPEDSIAEYHLYLPLYNKLNSLRLGLPETATLKLKASTDSSPIVVYGTSITQGACASRPGMTWTSLLSRSLQAPLVNLGFSGNGLLEPEIIHFMASRDARLFILDCLPNLGPGKGISEEEIRSRLRYAVNYLTEKHPQTPILLTSHAGYGDAKTNPQTKRIAEKLNQLLAQEEEQFKALGIQSVHLLPSSHIGLNEDDFVDGVHPTDAGMLKYSRAYEKIIRTIQSNDPHL